MILIFTVIGVVGGLYFSKRLTGEGIYNKIFGMLLGVTFMAVAYLIYMMPIAMTMPDLEEYVAEVALTPRPEMNLSGGQIKDAELLTMAYFHPLYVHIVADPIMYNKFHTFPFTMYYEGYSVWKVFSTIELERLEEVVGAK